MFWRVGLKGYYSGNVIVYSVNGCQACHALSWDQIPHGHHTATASTASARPTP